MRLRGTSSGSRGRGLVVVAIAMSVDLMKCYSLRLGRQHAAMGVHIGLHGYLMVSCRISGGAGDRNDRLPDVGLTVRGPGRGHVHNPQVNAQPGTLQDNAIQTDPFHGPSTDVP